MHFPWIVSFFSIATVATGQTARPIPAPTFESPTFPPGTNPKVTPDPKKQAGTLGPTAAGFTHEFGETFAPLPSPTSTKMESSGGTTYASVVVNLTGIAVATAVWL